MLSKQLKGTSGQFQDSDFTATQWSTAADKAKMANKLTKFILNGFPKDSFTKEMYKRLSNMFGHIAEYNIHGFYSVWFQDDAACLKWAENTMRGGLHGFVVGDPQFTWSDVEKALRKWIAENQIVEKIQNICNADPDLLAIDEPVAVQVQIDAKQLTLFEGNTISESYD